MYSSLRLMGYRAKVQQLKVNFQQIINTWFIILILYNIQKIYLSKSINYHIHVITFHNENKKNEWEIFRVYRRKLKEFSINRQRGNKLFFNNLKLFLNLLIGKMFLIMSVRKYYRNSGRLEWRLRYYLSWTL